MKPLSFYKKLEAFFTAEKAFFKNVSFVFGGRLYVAVLSLLLTPIIARLFTPTDYGEYGLYNTVVQNLVVVGTLSLPLAISTSKKTALKSVFNLSLSIILAFTILFFIGLLFLNQYLDAFFSTGIFSRYWLIVLLAFFITSIITSLQAVNIRLQQFKSNTTTGIIEGSSTKAFNLAGGWFGLHSIGLILSDVASKIISLFLLLKKLPKEIKLSLPGLSKTKETLVKFKQFPTFVMPSQWIGMLNNQFIILIVALLFSKNELGQLVMAIGLVGIPLHLLANGFQPVITERLTFLRGKVEVKAFFGNTALLLLAIATILFITIVVLPANIFTLILGTQWIGIKPIINVLAIYYIVLLMDQCFENGFIVLGKQKVVFYLSLIELILQMAMIVFAYILELPLVTMLILIATVRSLVSIIRVMCLWKNFKSANLEL